MPPQPWTLLILLAAALLAAHRPALGQNLTSAADLAALYALRSSLGLRARDWPRRADPCSAWSGVSCRLGRVVSISISALPRTRLGRLSPRFAVDPLQNLSALTSFTASSFLLPGPIPDWLATRPPLLVLALRSSAVTGAIPIPLASAPALTILDLSHNSITGNIPPLFQSTSLKHLNLSSNRLTGPIPPSLAVLPSLTVLDLSSNFLTGPVPVPALPNLTSLILAGNSLSGPLPTSLGRLPTLVSLDLSLNSLTGTLPFNLRRLRRLQLLNLSSNSLTGPLSSSIFSGMTSINSISVSHNNFTGAIPDSIWLLPALRYLDASFNSLIGTIAANVSGITLNLSNNLLYGSVSSSGFSNADLSGNYFDGLPPVGNGNVLFGSNCFRQAANQRSEADCRQFYSELNLPYDGPVASGVPPPEERKKTKWSVKYILIGVFAGIVVLGVVVLLIVLCLMGRGARSTEQRVNTTNAVVSGSAPPVSAESVNLSAVGDSYTYEQLLRATLEFSDDNLIKHGHSGDLYRGVLEGGIPVVVKKIDVRLIKPEAHLVELDFFAKASHTRIVPFLGHCLEAENEKLLVYKYMRHGDLSSALYRKPVQDEEGLQSLDWITRLKIATGVAEALCFMHHECTPPLVHRDVQASSILLDDKFEVRLGSLSAVCAQEGDSHQNVISRFLRLSSHVSEQSSTGSPPASCAYDVYCLGKVLLELVTGKLGISGSTDASTNEWLDVTLPYINIYEKELVTKIVDPSLIVDEDLLEEVWAMAIVARSCLNPKPSKRPLVRYILKALENPLKVVREESSSSSNRLRATSSRGSWNAALFGSWRHSSSDNIASSTGHLREDRALKRSGTMRSQGSVGGGGGGGGGDRTFSFKKPCKEIFPEPSGARDIED